MNREIKHNKQGSSKAVFSIVMPAFNSGRYLHETIKSVLNQNFLDFELIIVDDGSTDETAEIIRSFKDKRIKYVYQKNSGVSAARNKAIANSQAEWLAFLDSDDIWQKDVLSTFYQYINENDFLIGQYSYLRDNKNKKPAYSFKELDSDPRQLFNSLLDRNFIGIGAVAFRKNIVNNYFDEKLKFAEDYKLWLQLLSKKVRVKLIHKSLYDYRVHPGSALQNTADQEFHLAELINQFSHISKRAKKISSAHYNSYISMKISELANTNQCGYKFTEAIKYNISLKNRLKLLAYKINPKIIKLARRSS